MQLIFLPLSSTALRILGFSSKPRNESVREDIGLATSRWRIEVEKANWNVVYVVLSVRVLLMRCGSVQCEA